MSFSAGWFSSPTGRKECDGGAMASLRNRLGRAKGNPLFYIYYYEHTLIII